MRDLPWFQRHKDGSIDWGGSGFKTVERPVHWWRFGQWPAAPWKAMGRPRRLVSRVHRWAVKRDIVWLYELMHKLRQMQ